MWFLVTAALAQDYRFPIGDDDVQHAYPTAYVDHSGVDWDCGDIRYDGHRGSDFGIGSWSGMDAGRDVVAAAAGVVVAAHDGDDDRCSTGDCGTNGFGNHVKLTHADGKTTVYGHLKKDSVAVDVGAVVECGDLLGQVGSSGWSTGPHLHFAVWSPTSEAYVDPFEGGCANPPSYWVDQGDYGDVPGTTCEDPPACEPVAALRCGDRWEGTNAGTDAHAFWGTCSEWDEYTGSEAAFTLAPWPGPVTVRVTGLEADLDLFLLGSGRCAALDCLAASTESETADEQLAFESDGSEVVVVVDGFREASSSFALEVACDGAPPDTDDTAADTDPTGGRVVQRGETAGCGCGGGAAGGWAAMGLAVAALGRRRRR